MTKLLHIIASPREEASRTLQISNSLLEILKKKHPDWTFDEINLSKEALPDLSMKRVDGKYQLLQGKDLFGELKESWNDIIKQIERFLSADIYLISSPMWNFSIPYKLKHYIDLIVQPKYLFRYVENGIEGLAKNKKMIISCSRGGDYTSKETESSDFQEPYLRTIFGFVGITDITFLKAEPMDMGEDLQKQKLAETIAAAKQLAERM